MRWSLPRVGLLALLVGAALGVPPAWLHITIPGRTVHNSHYLAASFLYQLQTMLGAGSNSPNVMVVFGIRRCFSVSGNQVMAIDDAAIDGGIQVVHTRLEATAVNTTDA